MKSFIKAAVNGALNPFGLAVGRRFTGFSSDGLRSIHNHDFMADPSFQRAYGRGVAADRDYGTQWRTHIILWAASHGAKLQGDFVECGTFKGFMTSAIVEWLDWRKTMQGRRFYLFDTFAGLVESQLSDAERKLQRMEQFAGHYTDSYDQIRQNFAAFEGITPVRGMVPETLEIHPIDRVAYLHLDMNCAKPEVDALRFFWPRMAPSAIVVMDDYAYAGYQPQKEALDAVAAEFGVTIAALPTGQGLLVKPA